MLAIQRPIHSFHEPQGLLLLEVHAATIAPGYDDTIIRRPRLVVDRANGSYYMGAWEMVMVSKPQWVLVTSWNEWHEGSEIEPGLEFGDLYLNLTALYYGLFESARLTPTWRSGCGRYQGCLPWRKGSSKRLTARGLTHAS